MGLTLEIIWSNNIWRKGALSALVELVQGHLELELEFQDSHNECTVVFFVLCVFSPHLSQELLGAHSCSY